MCLQGEKGWFTTTQIQEIGWLASPPDTVGEKSQAPVRAGPVSWVPIHNFIDEKRAEWVRVPSSCNYAPDPPMLTW
jgi:hypothetical protein